MSAKGFKLCALEGSILWSIVHRNNEIATCMVSKSTNKDNEQQNCRHNLT